MKHERYDNLSISDDYLEYEFTSKGPKGEIPKIIQFTKTLDESTLMLAFGNKKADGTIDDLARDDNKDRNKILSTVVSAVRYFFITHPEKRLFFSGSTPERTRLYRMAICLNYEELSIEFEILGLLTEKDNYIEVAFEKGLEYLGFLVSKK
ncbi:hypothetical protein [Paraflavitalea sp. CAU 1676]|uniref:DUF6934 family protein n=1 Tax=Paraflavitalea sp. CAU 1676 TaxID=3032598 RepID=UPI0023DBD9B5|nr:hypothetical protein [Paraflavitalea sp. CAU 1676]MDF2193436.1 hypothetical protein [Paraflavitalea sp. CAU 1676]